MPSILLSFILGGNNEQHNEQHDPASEQHRVCPIDEGTLGRTMRCTTCDAAESEALEGPNGLGDRLEIHWALLDGARIPSLSGS